MKNKNIIYKIGIFLIAFAVLFLKNDIVAKAATVEALVDEGFVYVNSTEEGMMVIDQSILNMEPSINICFDESQVDNEFLVNYLYAKAKTSVGEYDYMTMLYAGFKGAYGRNYIEIDLRWRTTRQQEQLFDQTVQMLAPYLVGATPVETIKNVHDWICINTEYYVGQVPLSVSEHTGYSALFEKYAVCDGYAMLFQKFMDVYGIPCLVATGNDHAWNIVNIGGIRYLVDCTWDDQKFGIIYNYFLKVV